MPLTISVPGEELFDNYEQEFIYPEPTIIVLEHSLISISKWEAKWHKAYLKQDEKTPEETLDYIRCMSIKGEIKDDVINRLTRENVKEIVAYIDDPMTATTIGKDPNESIRGVQKNFTTSELIYSWMVSFGIPVEFEKWHLNRLLTLIKILDKQNEQPKKRSEAEIIRDYARINEINKKKFNTKG